jgi:hypothetical protein
MECVRMVGIAVKTEGGNVLTIDQLAKAIMKSIDRQDLKPEAAQQMATHVMNFFGYNDTIIDNILEPEDRDAFYMLEDLGLLMTEREETTLYDGREWRIHYWLFRKDRISELVSEDEGLGRTEEEFSSVYDEIPEDLWGNR